MSSVGLIGTIFVLVVGLVVIAAPFITHRGDKQYARNMAARRQRDEKLTAYERVLMMIRDLDEDYNTGKLSAEAYEAEREFWSNQGVRMLEELQVKKGTISQMTGTKPVRSSQPHNAEKALDDAIEEAIRAYVQNTGAATAASAPATSGD